MSGGYRHVSDQELDTAITYVREKYGVTLDRDMLRTVANDAGERYVRREHWDIARFSALQLRLRERDKSEALRYDAYKAAVGKIGSDRSQFARKRRAQTKAHPTTPQVLAALDPGTGQYSFVFSKTEGGT